jgi:uncharacterized membrane protein
MGTVETSAPGHGSGPFHRTFPLAPNSKSLTHIAYLVTILIKGFFGLLEFTGGVVIAVFGPQRLNTLVLQWTNPELYEPRQTEALMPRAISSSSIFWCMAR